MKRYALIAGAAIVILLLVSGIIAFRMTTHPTAETQQPTVEITNQTSSLEIISSRIEGDILQIDLRHIGTKPMIAYLFQYGDMSSGIGSQTGIFRDPWVNGETMYISIPLRNFPSGNVLKADLVTCIFEDFSGEGDWNYADHEREKLEGEALAYQAFKQQTAVITNMDTDINNVSAIRSAFLAKRPVQPNRLSKMQQVGFQNGLDSIETSLQEAARSVERGAAADYAPYFQKEMMRADRIAQRVTARFEIKKGGRDEK